MLLAASAWPTLVVALLVAAAGLGLADCLAVAREVDAPRPLTKLGAVSLLVAVAVVLDPVVDGPARVAIVAGLVLSLVGDALLLPQVDVFEGGLGAFLLAHVAYVVAFSLLGLELPWVLAGLVLLVPFLATVGRRVVGAVRAEEPALLPPVLVYIAAISAMAVLGAGTGRWQVAAGGLVFVASDAQLAWDRFVRADLRLRIGVMATYLTAQALLATSLLA